MSILNKGQITALGIVSEANPSSRRSTTYDATIGSIVCEGSIVEDETYELDRRGIVWVVSRERFAFGDNTTGLATLKTIFTHKGILALNVGVIDPGWDGPLATALVNFSGSKLQIRKGDTFFRVMFFEHEKTTMSRVRRSNEEYLSEIVEKSRNFSDTFLHINSLTDEVAHKVFKLPKVAIWAGWIGLGFGFAALLIPMGISIWTDAVSDRHEYHRLEQRIDNLENASTGILPDTSGVETRAADVGEPNGPCATVAVGVCKWLEGAFAM